MFLEFKQSPDILSICQITRSTSDRIPSYSEAAGTKERGGIVVEEPQSERTSTIDFSIQR